MAHGSAPQDCSRWRSEQFDDAFEVLADRHRRQALRYFQTTGDDSASVEEIIEYAIEREGETVPRETLAVEFHHVTLPKLDNVGAIEYDRDSRTVQYCEPPLLEQVLTVLVENEML